MALADEEVMSERGVFAVDRGIWSHELFVNGESFSRREAWMWLISEAAWKDRSFFLDGKRIVLTRGQVAHSIRYMAERWGWGKTSVSRFLDTLKNEDMIGTATEGGHTIITICKYNKFQKVSLPEDDDVGQKPGQPGDAQGTKQKTLNTLKQETPSLRSGVARARRSAPKSQKSLPDDWQPTIADLDFAKERGFMNGRLADMTLMFADHHRAKGNVSKDWAASWRTWVMKQIKFDGERGRGSPPPQALQQMSFADIAAGRLRRDQ